MRTWTDGDLRHMLSARNPANVTKLCSILYEAKLIDGSGKDESILASMVRRLKTGRFPTLTEKQTDYAASLLGYSRNFGLRDQLVYILNMAEQSGQPIAFESNVPPKAAAAKVETKVDVELAQAKARHLASVSNEPDDADIYANNPDFGSF